MIQVVIFNRTITDYINKLRTVIGVDFDVDALLSVLIDVDSLSDRDSCVTHLIRQDGLITHSDNAEEEISNSTEEEIAVAEGIIYGLLENIKKHLTDTLFAVSLDESQPFWSMLRYVKTDKRHQYYIEAELA